jgi:hypothetical protein
MNRRLTPIDARHCSVTRPLAFLGGIASMSLCNQIGVALHQCPGEGCGGSS